MRNGIVKTSQLFKSVKTSGQKCARTIEHDNSRYHVNEFATNSNIIVVNTQQIMPDNIFGPLWFSILVGLCENQRYPTDVTSVQGEDCYGYRPNIYKVNLWTIHVCKVHIMRKD